MKRNCPHIPMTGPTGLFITPLTLVQFIAQPKFMKIKDTCEVLKKNNALLHLHLCTTLAPVHYTWRKCSNVLVFINSSFVFLID